MAEKVSGIVADFLVCGVTGICRNDGVVTDFGEICLIGNCKG